MLFVLLTQPQISSAHESVDPGNWGHISSAVDPIELTIQLRLGSLVIILRSFSVATCADNTQAATPFFSASQTLPFFECVEKFSLCGVLVIDTQRLEFSYFDTRRSIDSQT